MSAPSTPPPTPAAPPEPPPAEALDSLLPPDVLPIVDGQTWRHPAATPVWYGVVWGRLGRGDLAWAHLDRVRLPELQPWIAAERGRVLRELGLHARAEALEWPALLDASDPVDAAMLRVSLAADAVGQGDADRAVRRLEAAREAVTSLPEGPRAARQRLRCAWVGIEVAWLVGDEPDRDGLPWWDVGAGAPAHPPDHAAGSRFHTAKGLLFAGVVRGDDRLLEAAAALAPPALAWAVHLARHDRGVPDAEAAARSAWRAIVPPPPYDAEVRDGATARRLGGV